MKLGPLLRGKHIMHGLSAKASDKRSESLFKPSSSCTLMKSNAEWNTQGDLLEFLNVEFIGMTVKHEGGVMHHLPCKISTRESRQQTMVSASAYRPISSEGANRG